MTFDAGGPAARLAIARRCQAVVVRSPLPSSIRRSATHSSCPTACHSCKNGGSFVWATCVVLKDCSRGTPSGTQKKAVNGVQFQSLHLVPRYAQAVSVGLGHHPHRSRMFFFARLLGPVCVCDKQHAPYTAENTPCGVAGALTRLLGPTWCGREAVPSPLGTAICDKPNVCGLGS